MPAPIMLPQPDEYASTLSRHYHAEFMHAFHAVRSGKSLGARIRDAIESVSARTASAPEDVTFALVQCGLRAPKEFLPESFSRALERTARDPDARRARLSLAQKELLQSWRAVPSFFSKPFASRGVGLSL